MARTLHFATATLAALITGSAAAVVINPVGTTGHNGGNWQTTLGHLTDMLNGNNIGFLTGDHKPGMTAVPTVDHPSVDADDPATWLYSPTHWENEWKANSVLDSTSSINSKVGWVVIDLGSAVDDLENLFLWNVRWQSNTENVDTYNVYTSSGIGIDALPAMPNSKGITGDYDFSSGDWAKVNGSALTLPQNTANNSTPQGTVGLGGVTAQYIAIEILSTGEPTEFEGGTVKRVGLAQVEITAAGSGGVTGDFDGDGDVDGVDIAEMFSNFNGPGGGVPTNPATDLDGDGDVDGVDIAQLFGAFTGPLAPTSVPEPASLALLGLLAVSLSNRGGLLGSRRRR